MFDFLEISWLRPFDWVLVKATDSSKWLLYDSECGRRGVSKELIGQLMTKKDYNLLGRLILLVDPIGLIHFSHFKISWLRKKSTTILKKYKIQKQTKTFLS